MILFLPPGWPGRHQSIYSPITSYSNPSNSPCNTTQAPSTDFFRITAYSSRYPEASLELTDQATCCVRCKSTAATPGQMTRQELQLALPATNSSALMSLQQGWAALREQSQVKNPRGYNPKNDNFKKLFS